MFVEVEESLLKARGSRSLALAAPHELPAFQRDPWVRPETMAFALIIYKLDVFGQCCSILALHNYL